MKKKSHTAGFTFIEIIVILTMIGIFVAFAVNFYNPFIEFQKTNDATRKADLRQVQKALEQYYQNLGYYPPSSKNYKIMNLSGQELNWGQQWQPYIDVLPKDPYPPRTYVYYASKDKQSYWFYASLERADKDPQSCNNGQACASLTTNNISPYTVCGGVCNYAVTSPNVTP